MRAVLRPSLQLNLASKLVGHRILQVLGQNPTSFTLSSLRFVSTEGTLHAACAESGAVASAQVIWHPQLSSAEVWIVPRKVRAAACMAR